ncbi:nuclear transport factor 2 family protein [Planobispora siamensis]|uniref:SnoaL-like domain-containing protein n=1 Tax=Planobispora siamensis TaxID=936338 RepID=A0A8J3WJV1_9ACTN|nr:nuclear transport factor 2 family protein [Planobispora siamensis]GIH93349.1 hypothetical protein Psi01_39790 [Planobispora siamensis]
MDLEERLVAVLTVLPQELAFGQEEPGVILDRYYTPEIVHVNDGIALDRDRLVAHVRPARRNGRLLRVEVHETLVSGDRAAARYTLHAVMRKGKAVTTEIYMFARFAPDGRVHRIDSVTRPLPAPDPDPDPDPSADSDSGSGSGSGGSGE